MNKILMLILLMPGLLVASDNKLKFLYEQRMYYENEGAFNRISEIDYEISNYYLSAKNYNLSEQFMLSSINYSDEDTTKQERINDLSLIYILTDNHDLAKITLLNNYNNSNNHSVKIEAAALISILEAMHGDYSKSKEFIKSAYILDNKWNKYYEDKIDSIFILSGEMKSIQKSKCLSLIPGLGQLYSENYKDMFGAIIVTLFWGGLVAYDFYTGDPLSAILIIIGPFQRYYRGNIYNAEKSAEKYNLKIIEEISSNYLLMLNENLK
jgi:hypothetical protein